MMTVYFSNNVETTTPACMFWYNNREVKCIAPHLLGVTDINGLGMVREFSGGMLALIPCFHPTGYSSKKKKEKKISSTI